jgi:isopenicillin N synthase-like dioxygenase
MDLTTLPVLSLNDEAGQFSRAIGASFRDTGFALVKDHGIDPDLIARGWDLTQRFFALGESEKQRYAIPGQGGARGYTPFGRETAKGAAVPDLKEFWHIGRDLPPGHRLAGASMPANLWPSEPADFREVFTRLFAEFDRAGAVILSRIAVDLGLPADCFAAATQEGNSVLRLLHYPPVTADRAGAIRAGAHEDINLITLLLGAEEAGLELLTRQGRWVPVSPPPGALVVNIGDMLQRLTNHVLPSTTHRVRNPAAARAGVGRYAMPFFLHLPSDYRLVTLPGSVSAGQPDRYPAVITADAFLQERLREIGLKG